MGLNDLIEVGEHLEPESKVLWVRGVAPNPTVHESRPLLGIGARPVTCYPKRSVIAEVALTLVDTVKAGEFRVKVRGAAKLDRDQAALAVWAQAIHGGLDIAAREAVRDALEDWCKSDDQPVGAIAKIFPRGFAGASNGAKAAVSSALRKIGLIVTAPEILPYSWNTQERVTLNLGPQRVECLDGGSAVNVTLRVDLIPDDAEISSFLTSKTPAGGQQSIRSSIERLTFEWLEGRYTRHAHAFESERIKAELRTAIDEYAGRRFGTKISLLQLDNGIAQPFGAEDEIFEFTASYTIAASKISVPMTHRCRVAVTDLGRATGGIEQKQAEVEKRIKVAVQAEIHSYSEDKVAGLLHTFEGSNANALSDWAIKNEDLKSQFTSRGITLRSLYIFTDLRKSIPTAGKFHHVTDYPIRGTERALKLSHDVIWHVNSDPGSQRKYIEKGALTSAAFESQILAKELDHQTSAELQTKSFGDIVFEYFQNQSNAENRISAELEKILKTRAAEFGVDVRAVTTVFEQIPESALLRGKMLRIEAKEYALAETTARIELGATVVVRFPPTGDGSNLKQHLVGDDPNGIFREICAGVADQIEFHMASVEPWAVFSMREAGISDKSSDIHKTLETKVNSWLAEAFGLELDPRHEFVVQIGRCALLDDRKKLIGVEDEVIVHGNPTSLRANNQIGTEVNGEVELLIPYRVVGVSTDEGSSRRFMEALLASGGSTGVREQISRIIQQAVSGFIQAVPHEAFNQSNFSLQRFRQFIADFCLFEVTKELGLDISISANRVVSKVSWALASHEAIESQATLHALIGMREAEKRRLDCDRALVSELDERIREQKDEVAAITRLEGVGGLLNQEALDETVARIGRFIDNRQIPPAALPRYLGSGGAFEDNRNE